MLWKLAVRMDFKGQQQLQEQLPQCHRLFWCLYVLAVPGDIWILSSAISILHKGENDSWGSSFVLVPRGISRLQETLGGALWHPSEQWRICLPFCLQGHLKGDFWIVCFCEHKIAVYLCGHRQMQGITGIFQPCHWNENSNTRGRFSPSVLFCFALCWIVFNFPVCSRHPGSHWGCGHSQQSYPAGDSEEQMLRGMPFFPHLCLSEKTAMQTFSCHSWLPDAISCYYLGSGQLEEAIKRVVRFYVILERDWQQSSSG